MRPTFLAHNALLARRLILGPAYETLAILHCNEYTFREQPNILVNSASGGPGFTSYNEGSFYWYGGEPPFDQCIFGGDGACTLHSNTKLVFPGAFCLEGFFLPMGINGTVMEIADGSAWEETGDNFIAFYNGAVDEDDNNWMVQTQIFAKPVGGSFSTIAVSNTWPLEKNGSVQRHVALYRDTNGYVGMSFDGVEMVRTAAPYPGTFNGHINFAGGYDQNTGTITKGGHQVRFGEFRATRGANVYTLPFTPRTTRFPNV